MIQEVIVVEGKNDIAAVKRSVDAECLATEGFRLSTEALNRIGIAYKKNGIIILTDPDSAGERIRTILTDRFPEAKHAFIPRAAATKSGDVGVEQASVEAIRSALAKTRYREQVRKEEFTIKDICAAGLTASADAMNRRAIIGDKLGIGYANTKTFLHRLNHYGVQRKEFDEAVVQLEESND
ncbi:MAG: Primase-related protein [Firmicutes bacterium]|nr:Primase-related protein [Bacillota bacterium]